MLSPAVGVWRWNHWDDLGFAGTLTPLGAAVYGAAVLTIEGGIKMFWALAQIEKDRKTFREEGRAEGRQDLAQQIRDAETRRPNRDGSFLRKWTRFLPKSLTANPAIINPPPPAPAGQIRDGGDGENKFPFRSDQQPTRSSPAA